MMASEPSFGLGDLVFAKVKEYSPWPAKIMSIERSKYNVHFYGTGETGNVQVEDLFPYEESKEKFATEINMKDFKEAIEQIESALAGEDPTPASFSKSSISANSQIVPLVPDDPNGTTAVTPKPAKESKPIGKETSVHKETGPIQSINNDTPEYVTSDAQSSTQMVPLVPDDPNGTTGVTPKPITESKLMDKETSVREITGPIQSINTDPPEFEISDAQPSTGETTPMNTYRKERNGTFPKKTPTQQVTRKRKLIDPFAEVIANLSARQRDLLEREQKLVWCVIGIKQSVPFNGANPARCLKLLNQYQDMRITATMLKKNPYCVEIIKKLRGYIGNEEERNMDDKERIELYYLTKQIRETAEKIYDRFPAMFPGLDKEVPFYTAFQEIVTQFRLNVQHLSTTERYLVVDEEEIGHAGAGR
uniref:Putative transcription coactivator n=1 Tax=Anopheles braziliensis TaxID=58242 RepID=A0A2M3ZI62_9DIPT